MKANILKKHAMENVWCEPIQDRQFILKPNRLTPDGGSLNKANLLWEKIALPVSSYTSRVFFHVYQIGKLSPIIFNMKMDQRVWYKVSDLCEANGEIIDIYFDNGAIYPREMCWLMSNNDGNLVMAIEISQDLDVGVETVISKADGVPRTVKISLDTKSPTVRFYNNERFNTEEFFGSSLNPTYPIRTVNKLINNATDYQDYRTAITDIETRYGNSGMSISTLDGYVVERPVAYSPTFAKRHLSFTWDSSIKYRGFIPMQGMPSFTSTLDPNIKKYLVVLNTSFDTIDYFDDIDFYLVKRGGTAVDSPYKGVMVPRLDPISVRQVTHNTYAIRADIIKRLAAAHSFLGDINGLHILAVVRQGGMKSGLINEHNRVKELYKLSSSSIIEALTGVNSLVPEWKAANLEASDYCKVMGTTFNGLDDRALIESAYGYNAAVQLAETTTFILKNVGGNLQFTVPPALCYPSPSNSFEKSIYVYDNNGLLLGWYNHNSFEETIVVPNTYVNAKYVEVFHGTSKLYQDSVIYNTTVQDRRLEYWGFRCYACTKDASGNLNNDWQDITDLHYYDFSPSTATSPPTIVWDVAQLNLYKLYPCVKINDTIWLNEKTYTASSYPGHINFSMSAEKTPGNSSTRETQLIPPGTLDVFMNGKSLIEDIDYYVEWPTIQIVAMPPTNDNPENISILVRGRGYCNNLPLKPFKARDVGFVRGGLLSVDGEYDLRDDRNLRVVAQGRLYHHSEVAFGEKDNAKRITDGRPFGVSDNLGVVECYTTQNTLDFYKRSREVDTRVGQYLTGRVSTVAPVNQAIIGDRHTVISPFLSAIINQMVKYDFLKTDVRIQQVLGFNIVEPIVQPFKYLLALDPCCRNTEGYFVAIRAHQFSDVQTINVHQYVFLEYLIRTYLNNMVDITPTVRIG